MACRCKRKTKEQRVYEKWARDMLFYENKAQDDINYLIMDMWLNRHKFK